MVWCFVLKSWENIRKTHWREAGLRFCSPWFFRWRTCPVNLRNYEKLVHHEQVFRKKSGQPTSFLVNKNPTVHITSRFDASVWYEPAGRELRRVRQKSWEGRWWEPNKVYPPKTGEISSQQKGGPFVTLVFQNPPNTLWGSVVGPPNLHPQEVFGVHKTPILTRYLED